MLNFLSSFPIFVILKKTKSNILQLQKSILFIVIVLFFCSCQKQVAKLSSTNTAETTPTEIRIISLAPSFTEVLCDLGLKDKIVGVSEDSLCHFSDDVVSMGRFFPVKDEAESELRKLQCLALKPTIIFAHDYMFTKKTTKLLYPLLYNLNKNIAGLSDLLEHIRLLSGIMQLSLKGEELIESIQWDLLEIRLRLGDVPTKKFLVLLNHNPLQVLGHSSFFSSIVGLYGFGSNMAPSAEIIVTLEKEDFSLLSPDVVIDLTQEQTPTALKKYLMDNKMLIGEGKTEWLIPSSKIVSSVKEIVGILYPNKQQ